MNVLNMTRDLTSHLISSLDTHDDFAPFPQVLLSLLHCEIVSDSQLLAESLFTPNLSSFSIIHSHDTPHITALNSPQPSLQPEYASSFTYVVNQVLQIPTINCSLRLLHSTDRHCASLLSLLQRLQDALPLHECRRASVSQEDPDR